MKRILLLTLMLMLQVVTASAAPVARPFTGIGLLFMQPGPLSEPTVSLYHQPGLGRIATLPWAQLPSLAHVLKGTAERVVATVADKRGEWLLITYDAAGREGWARMERSWRYLSWEEFLKGRPLRFLPGLRRDLYQMRREPSGEPLEELAGQELRAVDFRDDWCLVVTAAGSSGWVRWRDPDGRIAVSVETAHGNKSN